MLTRRGSSVSTDEKQPLNKDHADQDLKKDPDHVSTLQTKQTDNEFDSELDIEQPSVESRNTHVTEEREPQPKRTRTRINALGSFYEEEIPEEEENKKFSFFGPLEVDEEQLAKDKQRRKQAKQALTPKQRMTRIVAIVAGIAVCVFMVASSLAGSLNVSVMSSSGQFTDQPAHLAIYTGDVTGVLSDDDPYNDPDPVETKELVIGQRATFNVMHFGMQTLLLTLDDPEQASKVHIQPMTVNMWGIDMRVTYSIA